ncbi:hypothetical protein Lsed01_02021 [Demequina sediminis]|uniref:DUF998 domain-containing protein n=1 Tax=Demequina sediminis TaxID=1930058 RepID=A0ABP9WL80_9MICO|nr:hypothetical protein [Demequina sediminis]BDZ61618.1 hypothetical protein GCM10025873_14090 [Demequina sediminis]
MTRHLAEPTVRTYLYLRVAIVAAIALLFIALALEIVDAGWPPHGSISAYFYTAVQPIFVSTLIGAAILLVLVAIIPTPVLDESLCGSATERCVPEEFLPEVDRAIGALGWLAVLGLAFALWTLRSQGWGTWPDRVGIAAGVAVWLLYVPGFARWWGEGVRAWLLDYGHYAAAIPAFGLMVVIALVNARETRREVEVAGRHVGLRRLYQGVAAGIAAVIAWGIVVYVVQRRADTVGTGTLIFWVEALLLALFAAFWVVQTVEWRREGLPETAR